MVMFYERKVNSLFYYHSHINKPYFKIISKQLFFFNLLFYINSVYNDVFFSQKYKFKIKKNIVIINGNS